MWTEDEEYDEEDMNFQRWLDGGDYASDKDIEPGCGRVMQWLHDQGHVPAGTYGVEIWW
jgi:hypothetical protein